MNDGAPEAAGLAVTTTDLVAEQLDADTADGDGLVIYASLDNGTLVDAIRKVREIAKDLQLRSMDDRDPSLALRAHEIKERIGVAILERLLLAQGGQAALDELNAEEHGHHQRGIRSVYPHH